MKTKIILKLLKEYLENDNLDELDNLLTEIFSEELPPEQEETLWDILNEATLYIEFKEDEYKQEALRLISEIK